MRRFASKDSKRDFYILYTLVFGVIAGFIYYQFAGNGKSLVWSHDGIPQHLNSLAYYGRYLREVLHTIFVEHKLELPMWDMNIGYGSDILTTLHYYCLLYTSDYAVRVVRALWGESRLSVSDICEKEAITAPFALSLIHICKLMIV